MDVQVGYLVRALRADPGMVLGRLANDDLLEIQQALGKFLDERFAEDRTEMVINRCFGGFGLSDAAKAEMLILGVDLSVGVEHEEGDREVSRTHPALVATIKKLGRAADGSYASLAIVSVPRHLKWRIHYYDGYESIVIMHPTSNDAVRYFGEDDDDEVAAPASD